MVFLRNVKLLRGLNIEKWPKKRNRGRRRYFDESDVSDETVEKDKDKDYPDNNNDVCRSYKSQVFTDYLILC